MVAHSKDCWLEASATCHMDDFYMSQLVCPCNMAGDIPERESKEAAMLVFLKYFL